jgi:hypothetical protein
MSDRSKRPPITLPNPEIPDDALIHRMRDAVLEYLLDTTMGADLLGELVRMAWVGWAREQANPKPGWLVPWAELDEADQEADRRIGLTIARYMVETLIRVSYKQRKGRQQSDRADR